MIRSFAAVLVLVWWFSQVPLRGMLLLWMQRPAAQAMSIILSFVLGFLLYHSIPWRDRLQRLQPAWVLYLMGACALWLVLLPWTLEPASALFHPVRAYAEWSMVLALIGGTAWLVLALEPAPVEVIGVDQTAPRWRLGLGIAISLWICQEAWKMPWLETAAINDFFSGFAQPHGRHESTASGGFIVASQWIVQLLPYLCAAAFVGFARIGPRINAKRSGVMRISVIGSLLFVLLISFRLFSGFASDSSPQWINALGVVAMFALPHLPPLEYVLLWATLQLLLTLGPRADEAVLRAPQDAAPKRNSASKATTLPSNVAAIRKLLVERKTAEAFTVYLEVSLADPEFDPGAAAVVPLGKYALAKGRPKDALRLVTVSRMARPTDGAQPIYGWLEANALLALQRIDEGTAVLQALMVEHPTDPLAREARMVLERVRGQKNQVQPSV